MNSIKLPARCDRAAAETLFPEFVAAMGSGATEVDGEAVTMVGQGMLQLLVSARRSGNGAVIKPSEVLLNAAKMTGLSGELFDEDAA
jgi:hypothetical protein